MNDIDRKALADKAKLKLNSFRELFKNLRKLKGKELDNAFMYTHDNVFEKTDCLQCGNCCQVGTPVFSEKDVERAAKRLKMKPGDFTHAWLFTDSDGDKVLKSTPCPFLGEDNYCSIYEDRPEDCRNFPHTRRKPMLPRLNVVLANTAVCPAAMKILEIMQTEYRT
jgi:hypothetical protein